MQAFPKKHPVQSSAQPNWTHVCIVYSHVTVMQSDKRTSTVNKSGTLSSAYRTVHNVLIVWPIVSTLHFTIQYTGAR
jgi:hypothetical protein